MRYSSNPILFYSLFVLLSLYSCGHIATIIHEECTTVKPYQFNIPVKTLPSRSVFQVGDTVAINFNFNAKIKDQTDGNFYDFKNAKAFYPVIRLYRLEESVKNPFFFDFSDTCCIHADNLLVDHNLQDRESRNDAGLSFDYIYDQSDDAFYGKVSYIMKENGIYYFKINILESRQGISYFPNKCGTRLVDFYCNQQTDGNFDLVKNFIYPNGIPYYIDNIGKQQFIADGGYAFEVK